MVSPSTTLITSFIAYSYIYISGLFIHFTIIHPGSKVMELWYASNNNTIVINNKKLGGILNCDIH
jgi:hypothetical protein